MVACITALLPLSQEMVASLFPLTLVTPNYAGRIPLKWGLCRVLGGLGQELGTQQHSLPQTWGRGWGRAWPGVLGVGAGWAELSSHPHL